MCSALRWCCTPRIKASWCGVLKGFAGAWKKRGSRGSRCNGFRLYLEVSETGDPNAVLQLVDFLNIKPQTKVPLSFGKLLSGSDPGCMAEGFGLDISPKRLGGSS